MPPHWLSYFGVADVDKSTARAIELGAKVLLEPHDVPNIGRFAIIRDPQGAAFAVIRLSDA